MAKLKKTSCPKFTHPTEHSCLTSHQIDWDDSEVIATESEWDKCCYVESWMIRSSKHTMNRDFGTLSPLYNCLLQS